MGRNFVGVAIDDPGSCSAGSGDSLDSASADGRLPAGLNANLVLPCESATAMQSDACQRRDRRRTELRSHSLLGGPGAVPDDEEGMPAMTPAGGSGA
jgi:hypothetical protein